MSTAADRGPRRVDLVQAQLRPTLILAAAFGIASAASAALPHDTGEWLPLHLALVGALGLGLSGTAIYLAASWSASDAPAISLVRTVRGGFAVGATALALGREWHNRGLATLGGLSVLLGVIAAVAALEHIRRTARQGRFVGAIHTFSAAFVCLIVGGGIGVVMTSGHDVAHMRDAHVVVNLVGFVGLVVIAALPWFSATTGRTKTSPRLTADRQIVVAVVVVVGLIAVEAGLIGELRWLATSGAAAVGVGWVGAGAMIPSPTSRSLKWAGPRLIQLWISLGWFVASIVILAVDLAAGREPFVGAGLWAFAVGGALQLLTAGLAYIGPVLRGGGPEHLGAGFRLTRSWTIILSANTAVVALLVGASRLGVIAALIWAAELAARGIVLLVAPRPLTAPRPASPTSSTKEPT